MPIQFNNVHKIKSSDAIPYEIDAGSLSDQNKADLDAAGTTNEIVLVMDGIHLGDSDNPHKYVTLETLYYVGHPYVLATEFSAFVIIGGTDINGTPMDAAERFKFDDSAKIIMNTSPDPPRAATGSSNGRDLICHGGNQGSYDRRAYRVDSSSPTTETGMTNRVNCLLNGRKAGSTNNGIDWVQGCRLGFTPAQTNDFEKYRLETNTSAVMTYTTPTDHSEGGLGSNKREIIAIGANSPGNVAVTTLYKLYYDDSVSGFTLTNSLVNTGVTGDCANYQDEVIWGSQNNLQRIQIDDSAAVVVQSNGPSLGFYDQKLAGTGTGEYARSTGYVIGSGVVNNQIFKYKFDDSAAEVIMTNTNTVAIRSAVIGRGT